MGGTVVCFKKNEDLEYLSKKNMRFWNYWTPYDVIVNVNNRSCIVLKVLHT